ncbi:Ribosome-recycling factor [compost metagenome]
MITNMGIALKDIEHKMKKAVTAFRNELSTLRTGTAHPALLDSIRVDAYESNVPLTQVANVGVIDPRTLSVSVWDKSVVKHVDKAIRESKLGLNPVVDGLTLRIPLPVPSQERRHDLIKIMKEYAEEHRVSVRTIRRDSMNHMKKLVAANQLPQHTMNSLSTKIQDLTDKYVEEINTLQTVKAEEILKI